MVKGFIYWNLKAFCGLETLYWEFVVWITKSRFHMTSTLTSVFSFFQWLLGCSLFSNKILPHISRSEISGRCYQINNADEKMMLRICLMVNTLLLTSTIRDRTDNYTLCLLFFIFSPNDSPLKTLKNAFYFM